MGSGSCSASRAVDTIRLDRMRPELPPRGGRKGPLPQGTLCPGSALEAGGLLAESPCLLLLPAGSACARPGLDSPLLQASPWLPVLSTAQSSDPAGTALRTLSLCSGHHAKLLCARRLPRPSEVLHSEPHRREAAAWNGGVTGTLTDGQAPVRPWPHGGHSQEQLGSAF